MDDLNKLNKGDALKPGAKGGDTDKAVANNLQKQTIYDQYPQLQEFLHDIPNKAIMAKRTAPVFAMRVPADKIGTAGETKIFDDEKGRVVETRFAHKEVLLANPRSNGKRSENEWPKGEESFFRDYIITKEAYSSREPGQWYKVESPARQAKPLLKVTPEVIKIMGGEDGKAILPVSWDPAGAEIKEGSYITHRGKPLSERDFKNTYTEITEEKWLTENIINKTKRKEMHTFTLFMTCCHNSDAAITDEDQKKIEKFVERLSHAIAEGEVFLKVAPLEKQDHIHEIILSLKFFASEIAYYSNNTSEKTKNLLDNFKKYALQFEIKDVAGGDSYPQRSKKLQKNIDKLTAKLYNR